MEPSTKPMMGKKMVWRVDVLTTQLRSLRAASLREELGSAYIMDQLKLIEIEQSEANLS